MKASERSLQFKKNYLALREKGLSVQEIAKTYSLSKGHAYELIRALATESGVSYESLLVQPHRAHIIMGSGKVVQPVKPVDPSGFQEESRSILSALDSTIYKMDKILTDWPAMPETLKEGEE